MLQTSIANIRGNFGIIGRLYPLVQFIIIFVFILAEIFKTSAVEYSWAIHAFSGIASYIVIIAFLFRLYQVNSRTLKKLGITGTFVGFAIFLISLIFVGFSTFSKYFSNIVDTFLSLILLTTSLLNRFKHLFLKFGAALLLISCIMQTVVLMDLFFLSHWGFLTDFIIVIHGIFAFIYVFSVSVVFWQLPLTEFPLKDSGSDFA